MSADDGQPRQSGRSLQRHLALVGEAARGSPPGRHGCDVGFAIALADMLRARYNHMVQYESQGEPPFPFVSLLEASWLDGASIFDAALPMATPCRSKW